MDDVLNEVSMLAGSGCQEVVLTGIHLSSYGVDLGTSLIELIQAVHEVDGITRIRLGSSRAGHCHTGICAYLIRASKSVSAFSSFFAERL